MALAVEGKCYLQEKVCGNVWRQESKLLSKLQKIDGIFGYVKFVSFSEDKNLYFRIAPC